MISIVKYFFPLLVTERPTVHRFLIARVGFETRLEVHENLTSQTIFFTFSFFFFFSLCRNAEKKRIR